ncbi:hypothetical protein B7P43_G07845 [Cryptotermes secundus]|uniref:Uncharacterized protein n=1 Tax=Cryptotermes secundus TaxID=105785 RepID=A0A2J7QF13_9NEOP|nr:hypothetical protein B7P43_G07845 [Cryptotermes secundus]
MTSSGLEPANFRLVAHPLFLFRIRICCIFDSTFHHDSYVSDAIPRMGLPQSLYS